MKHIATIRKEEIPSLNFYQEDVAETDEQKRQRIKDLTKAITFGNGYRRKVKVIFKKADGELNQVETTIWAVGKSFVTLKEGLSLPLGSILKVDF